jgi:transposase
MEAKKFLQKIKRVAMLKGVEVVEVNPAYTSIIGMLKYAPQLNIDKDIAGAYVVGRRALGFKEDKPENYEKLLKDKVYLELALKRYGGKETYGAYREGKQRIQEKRIKKRTKECRECKEVINQFSTKPSG